MKETQITHQGPEVLNDCLPLEHQQQLDRYVLEVDGKPALIGWRITKGTGLVPQWGIYWSDSSKPPQDFFSIAEKCSDAIGDLDVSYIVNPADGKKALVRNQTIEIGDIADTDSFMSDELVSAVRFDTPYVAFSQNKRSDGKYSGFMTWINHTDELVRFIVDAYGYNHPPKKDVKELLEFMTEDWSDI